MTFFSQKKNVIKYEIYFYHKKLFLWNIFYFYKIKKNKKKYFYKKKKFFFFPKSGEWKIRVFKYYINWRGIGKVLRSPYYLFYFEKSQFFDFLRFFEKKVKKKYFYKIFRKNEYGIWKIYLEKFLRKFFLWKKISFCHDPAAVTSC